MKRKLQLLRTLLVAVGLLVGANVCATEGDVIYSNDFSTNNQTDFASWISSGGSKPTGYSYTQIGRNGAFSIETDALVHTAPNGKASSNVYNADFGVFKEDITTKTASANYVLSFDITLAITNHIACKSIFEISGEDKKTIICLYAEHTRSNANTGATTYGYIVGGNNAFAVKDASVTDGKSVNAEGSIGDGTQIALASSVDGTTGSKTYHVTLDAQTSGLAKLTIKEGENTVVNNVDVNISAGQGLKYVYFANHNSWQTPSSQITIDNLSIVEGAESTAATANYTVKYVTTINDAETEIKSSDTRTGIVNSSISLTNADKNTIWYENKKYIYSSDNASSSTIANDNSTVVKVMFTEAPSYTYSVVDNLGNTLASGSSYQGENVDFYVPYYAFKDGKFYYNPNLSSGTLSYGKSTITAIAGNTNITVTYTEEENSNVVFFSEAENLTGIKAFSDNYTQIRMSNGQGGYYESQTAFVTLPAGVYTLTSATRQGKTYFFSGTVGEGIEIGTVESSGSVVTTTSKLFTLTKETDIYTSVGSTSAYFDYVIIRRISDVASISQYGYATFSSTSALDFTNVDNAKAYIVTGKNGNSITTQQVEGKVAANTGLILKSNDGGEATVTIPVTTEEGTTYNTQSNPKNYLFAVGSDYPLAKSNDGTNYVLVVQSGKVVFAPIGDTSANVKKGQAALWLKAEGGETSGAHVLTLSFGDDVTGINTVKGSASTVNGVYYNLNGQRVSEPKQGIYVVDGKKVLVK